MNLVERRVTTDLPQKGSKRPARKAATTNEVPQENAKFAKKRRHNFFSLSSLHCTPSASRNFAKILPRISRMGNC
ncbi:MAG: hypothetical protein ACLQVY_22400, partial [Limisphaerales bacterium]